MLWKCDLDTNANSRVDDKTRLKGKYCEEYMAQHKKRDAGVPDGTVNCKVHTMSQISLEDIKTRRL